MAAVFGKKPPRLETPPGASPAVDLPPIYVIPDEFYGAALHRPLPKLAAPASVAAAPPPKPPPPAPAPVASKKKPSRKLALIFAVLAVLTAGGAGAAWYVLRTPSAPLVVAPVCGNAVCDASESPFTCRQDCGAPAPVCGDGSCEAPESAQSCAADCAPAVPAPVCGNGQCEADETAALCAADCPPPAPLPGFDTDNDGLTDLEESTVFGSNSRSANTDSDSFVDLNEVLNLFDPVVPAPASLAANPRIATYVSAPLGLTLYRPQAWLQQSESAEEKAVVFAAPTGETVTARVFEKQTGETLGEWYARTYSSAGAGEGLDIRPNRRGHEYAMHEDRTRAWVALSATHVVGLRYDLGGAARIEFATTFAMMLNSVDVPPAP